MNINGTAGTILVCPTYYFLAALISDIKGRHRGALANQGANCARPASVGTACDNNSPVFKLPHRSTVCRSSATVLPPTDQWVAGTSRSMTLTLTAATESDSSTADVTPAMRARNCSGVRPSMSDISTSGISLSRPPRLGAHVPGYIRPFYHRVNDRCESRGRQVHDRRQRSRTCPLPPPHTILRPASTSPFTKRPPTAEAACAPACSVMSTIRRRTLASANAVAVARPIPTTPPVITATLPSSSTAVPRLEYGDRIRRRTGATNDAQRSDNKEKLVPVLLGAHVGEWLE